MATKAKLKIFDNSDLRCKLDAIYETASPLQVAQWSLAMSVHILNISAPDFLDNEIIQNGFNVNRLWQQGKARVHDVRQAGFKVHELAKQCEDQSIKLAIRVVGQSIATGHMKEHGMVASDYAIKYINVNFHNDYKAVTREREWQIDCILLHLTK